MALYPEPIGAILDSIKALNNGVDLEAAEYNFGPSTPVAPDLSGTNTKLNIAAKGPASTFSGDVDVRHKRLDLADLLVLVPADIRLNGVTDTLSFALLLNSVYGTNFTTDDIVTEPVNLVNGSGTVTINAKPTSRAWLGSVTFNLTLGRIQLKDVIVNTILPGLDYADPYEAKPFGNAYSYWRDYSTQSAILDVLVAGDAAGLASVKTAMINVTGDQWVTVGSSRFSLEGAEILFVGNVADYPELNQTYQKGVVVKLGAACLGYSGRLFMHYNLPEVD